MKAATGAARPRLQIGIATTRFRELTNAALAGELAAAGIRLVQLFLTQSDSRFWKYNGRSDVSSLTAARCREIATAYRDAGISIHSIGVYTNLIHPDEAGRRANLGYFETMMEIDGHMGVRTFVSVYFGRVGGGASVGGGVLLAGQFRGIGGVAPELFLEPFELHELLAAGAFDVTKRSELCEGVVAQGGQLVAGATAAFG